MTIITYQGANPALIDVLAGHAHATLVNVLSAAPHMKAGRLRELAVTSLERHIADEIARWQKVAQAAGLKAQ